MIIVCSQARDPDGSNWDKRYRDNDTPWDRGGASPFLAVCLERLEPGSSVLVPGCGAGHEVAALAGLGFRVTGIDLSQLALASCRAKLEQHGLEAELVQASVLEWEAPQTFDAVYEQTCLCALHFDHWEAYAKRLANWLRPEGRLCAAFMQTGSPGGPPFDCPIPRMKLLFPHPVWQWPELPPVRIERGPKPYELGCILTRR